MAEANWVQLAQAGDASAIAVLMNGSLQTIGIQARATLREGHLHVLLESERILTPRSCAEFLRRGIEQLGVGWISEAIVYSRAPGQPAPSWVERVDLTTPAVENPFVLPPHAALEESYFRRSPPFVNWKRVRLFDLLLLGVPVLVVLTSVYIWSRYLGVQPIALPGATPAQISTPADVFQVAQLQASHADRQTQMAKLQDKRQWRQVMAEWQQASELMKAVPAQHPKYAIAQQKIQEYRQNAKSLMDLKLNAVPEMVLKRTINNGIMLRSIVSGGRNLIFAPTGQYGHSIEVYNREEQPPKQISTQVKLAELGYPQFPGTQQGSPVAAAPANDGLSLWVANDQMTGEGLQTNNDETCTPADSQSLGFLYRVSTDTLNVDRAVQVGASPKSVAASPDDRYVLASNWCSWDVSVVDAAENREVRRIQVGAYPRGIAIAAQTKTAYVAVQGTDAIATINLKDFSTTQIPAVGQAPHHLVLDPADKFLYISLLGEGQVAKLDLTSQTIVGKVATGKSPRSLAISNDGQFLYVVNYDSDTVAKLRTQDMQIVQTVRVNSAPIGVAYDAKTHQVWVASASGSIQVFQD
jgi:YVTN family beta-propeller protein